MDILEELKKYCNKCLNDIYVNEFENYISCEKHKQACKRFLNDLERIGNDDFPYIWNEDQAQKIVDWFTYLRHSKGVLAGTPIYLTTWQKFCICQIYGWIHKDTKLRRFTKSFIEVARKNAKSQMESGIALYELACGSTKNHEVYEINCAGVKRKQSKVVFDECKHMLKGSPLKLKFKLTRDAIVHIKTESIMIPLCKEDKDKGDGGNPALFIIDEYHQHPTDEFYSLGAYGANTKEPLLMIITTAGTDLNYPCYTQEYKYTSNILNSNVDIGNDTYFVDILELDKGDDESNINNWYKSNPIRMTYEAGQKKIAEEYKIAKEVPEKMPMFLTKCLNVWVQAKENGYMNMAKWKSCEVKELPDLKNKDVFVGVDMSAKIDLTSVTFVIPIMIDNIKKYIIFSHSFIPNREKLTERTKKDKAPYDAWERLGYLSVTDTPTVNQEYVKNYIIDTCKKNEWNIYNICPDPHDSTLFSTELSNEGYEVVEVYQSAKSLNDSTTNFRVQVYDGNVMYLNNPLLNFSMANAVVKSNNGNIKIDKDAAIQRIDPVDALLCAYQLAMYYEFEEQYDPIAALMNANW